MITAFVIGRIIVAMFYLYNGTSHFMKLDMMSGYAQSKGVPAPRLAVMGSGLLLFVAGLSFLLGFMPLLGVIALVLFFIPTSLIMHNFWAIEDPAERNNQMINFSKNMALMGSALMFLAIPTPWPVSLGG